MWYIYCDFSIFKLKMQFVFTFNVQSLYVIVSLVQAHTMSSLLSLTSSLFSISLSLTLSHAHSTPLALCISLPHYLYPFTALFRLRNVSASNLFGAKENWRFDSKCDKFRENRVQFHERKKNPTIIIQMFKVRLIQQNVENLLKNKTWSYFFRLRLIMLALLHSIYSCHHFELSICFSRVQCEFSECAQWHSALHSKIFESISFWSTDPRASIQHFECDVGDLCTNSYTSHSFLIGAQFYVIHWPKLNHS